MGKKKGKPSDGARIYKVITVVGTSRDSYEAAVRNAVKQASKTVEGLAWFEVGEQRGLIEKGDVAEYQASVNIGFRLKVKS